MPTRTRLPSRRRRNPTDWFGYSVADDIKVTVSSKPISTIEDMTSLQADFHKPAGLWYACGGAWISWLESEMPDWLEDGKHLYKVFPKYSPVSIGDFHRMRLFVTTPPEYLGGVLRLTTEEDIYSFNRAFAASPTGLGSWGRRGWEVKWGEVARVWDGIEICPYQRGLRYGFNLNWYATWDVASGCIWRPAGLASPLSLLKSR